MKLYSIAMFEMFALLFMVIALNNNNKIECNHLAEMRVSIKNIDFSLVHNVSTINSSIYKNDQFDSHILYDKISVLQSDFKFEKFYDNITIIFGKHSSSWILAKRINSNLKDIYVSRNNEAKFTSLNINFQFNDLLINPVHQDIIIITNDMNNKFMLSMDNGYTFQNRFSPGNLYFTNDIHVLIALDEQTQKLWLSKDSGQNWHIISNNTLKISSENILLESDLNYFYFIEPKNELKQLIQFDLANFNSSFETDTFKKILNNDIINFEWSDGFFLLTAKSESKNVTELSISRQGYDFHKAVFPIDLKKVNILNYKFELSSKTELFVTVEYKTDLNEVKKDLFVSKIDKNSLIFELTLSSLDENFQMISLNNNNAAYIANSNTTTFIKSSKKSTWTKTNQNLNLNDNFIFFHEDQENSFSAERLPDLMISYDSKLSGVYASEDPGTDWYKILDENYVYSSLNDDQIENVIIAAKINEPINSIIYSQDSGNNWNEYRFSKNYIYVNMLLVRHGRVLLFCTRANKKSMTLFTFELKPSNDLNSIQYEHDFDLNGLFEIKYENKLLNYSIDLPSDLRLNNYLIKIVLYSNSNDRNDFEILDLDESTTSSQQIYDDNKEIKTEKIIKTFENHLDLVDLKSSNEYQFYFYANLTSFNTNETKHILLDKKLVIRKLTHSIQENYFLIVFTFITICFLPIFICLIISQRRIFFNTIDSKTSESNHNFKKIYHSERSENNPNDLNIFIVNDKQRLIEHEAC